MFHPCLIALSEGSVIAYYLSEFKVPAGQEASVDKAMSTMGKLVDKEQRFMSRPANSLVLEDVISSGRVKATEAQTGLVCHSVHNLSCCFVYGLLSASSSPLFMCVISQHLIPD